MARDLVALRFEVLRMRAAIERAELAASMRELGNATGSLRRLAGGGAGMALRLEGRRPVLASAADLAVSLLRDRPWLLTALAAGVARRGLSRWLAIGAVAALSACLVRAVAPATKRDDDASG